MDDLKSSKKRIVGYKQTIKVIKNRTARKVYLADDVDQHMKNSVIEACKEGNIELIKLNTMKELGDACGIEVGASTVALLVE